MMNVYSYLYSDKYSPVAPAVEVAVHAPGSVGNQVRLTLLLDTGADVTALSVRVLRQINAEYVETLRLYGITGGRIRVDMYRVALQVGPHTVSPVRVAGIGATSNAVLGRDVLNHLTITLNGPANMTEIEG